MLNRLATLCKLFAEDDGATVDKLIRAFAIYDNEAALEICAGNPKVRDLALFYLGELALLRDERRAKDESDKIITGQA
ncbi:MAG: hypothetical protein ACLQGV_06030 [Bryobacteraceae bacterium]